jgi:hypothetical protein
LSVINLKRSYCSDYRRQNSSQYSRPTAHQSTEIPREVLSLLHAQNFHPESLENLKDVFRRNNPQHGLGDEEGIYPRVPQDHFESSREAYGRYRQDRSAGRRDISYEEWNPPRERLPGNNYNDSRLMMMVLMMMMMAELMMVELMMMMMMMMMIMIMNE